MDESLDIFLSILLGPDMVRKFEGGMVSIEKALEGVDKESLRLADTFANKLEREMKALDNRFAKTRQEIERTKQVAEKLGAISQTMLVAGTAIVGSMYIAAKNEADRIKEAGGEVDAVTASWLAANERLEASQQKIGKSAMTALVPVMEKAASLAGKAASFAERNPQLVSAALNVGLISMTLGAIGSAVSKGIRLLADAKFLFAQAQFTVDAALIKKASTQMFEAAVLMNKASGKNVLGGAAKAGGGGLLAGVGGAGALSIAGTVAAVLAVIAAGATVGAVVYDILAKQFGLTRLNVIATGGANVAGQAFGKAAVAGGMSQEEADRKTLVFTYLIGRLTKTIDEGDPKWKAVAESARNANESLDGVAESISTLGSVAEDEAEAMKKMTDLARENAKAEREYAHEREDIYTESERSLADVNRKLGGNLRGISRNLASDIAKIKANLENTLTQLSQSFAEANIQAEREYESQRADIVRDGAETIRDIQKQKQKDLEDLERSHSQTVRDLTAERDALGLVLENNAYEERRSEIEQNAAEQIEQARANTQAQLEEAQRNYEEQRAQRMAEYQRQQEEAKAQAAQEEAEAKAKAEEDRKKAIADAAEERKEIERKRAEALADLKKAYDRERKERITAVYNEITDLRGALNAEMLMRRQYQNQILADATAHMQAMARAQAAANTSGNHASTTATLTPKHDYSGYAYTGLYAMAQNGQREFVLGGAATKAAESIVGGQLNEQMLMAGLAGQRGGTQYIDQSQYSGMTVADARRVRQISRQTAIDVMAEVYRK